MMFEVVPEILPVMIGLEPYLFMEPNSAKDQNSSLTPSFLAVRRFNQAIANAGMPFRFVFFCTTLELSSAVDQISRLGFPRHICLLTVDFSTEELSQRLASLDYYCFPSFLASFLPRLRADPSKCLPSFEALLDFFTISQNGLPSAESFRNFLTHYQ